MHKQSPTTTASWQSDLDQTVDATFDEMVRLRRRIHMNPEISGQEYETSLFLYQLLGDCGFEVRMGPDGRGVVADSKDDGQIRCALRADIDALRIHDAKTVEYRSQRDGIMHACGHDSHTATIYGALTALRKVNAGEMIPWPVSYRGIFQPAEETCTGAAEMVEAGCLDGVGAIMAVHMDPTRQVGRVGLRSGILTANCDAVKFTVLGRGGHAARPHESIDPIAAAAQLINSIYQFVPRATDSHEAVVFTIGQIQGGENPNVIPEEVELYGTLRTLNASVREQTLDHLRQLVRGVGEISGAKIELEIFRSVHAVRNDEHLATILRESGEAVIGAERLEDITRPSMGSEDFAVYLDHVPGAMLRLGSTGPGVVPTGLHTPEFDIDEEAMRVGAKMLARSVVLWSNPERLGATYSI